MKRSKGRARRSKKGWIIALIILLVIAGGVFWAYSTVTSALNGRDSLTAGFTALEANDPAGAQDRFKESAASFDDVRRNLGPSFLHAIPFVGRQVEAVDQLATIGAEGSKVGVNLTTLIKAQDSEEGLSEILANGGPEILGSLDSFQKIAHAEGKLSTDGLVAPLAQVVESTSATLKPMHPILQRADSISTFVRYALGSDHRFLVLSQNNAEIRATGGFLGSYGLLKVGPSGIELEHYGDITELKGSTISITAPEGAIMNGVGARLELHDANWWIDNPVSVDTVLKLYDNQINPQPAVDGVISIDLITIKTLLGEFGPITLAEYGKTFTAENMIETLTVMIEQEISGSGNERKEVLTPLGNELLHRLMNVPAEKLMPTGQLILDLADEKRIQIYTRDSTVQEALVSTGWAGAIDKPEGTTDLLAVTNSLVFPSKMNLGVHKTIDYEATINADGSADTTLKLHYVKDSRRVLEVQRKWFGNYLRVYRPDGTTLTGATSKRTKSPMSENAKTAAVAPTLTTDKLGFPTIAAGFDVSVGETRDETYNSHIPNALADGPAPSMLLMPTPTEGSTAGTQHYRLLLVKQPDLEETPVQVTVHLPEGMDVVDVRAWRRTNGEVLQVSNVEGLVNLNTELSTDIVLDIVVKKA